MAFFKINKVRRFNYKPVYYDARKEAFNKLVAHVRAEKVAEREGTAASKIKFERKIAHHDVNKGSNIRLAVIIVILTLVLYIFLR